MGEEEVLLIGQIFFTKGCFYARRSNLTANFTFIKKQRPFFLPAVVPQPGYEVGARHFSSAARAGKKAMSLIARHPPAARPVPSRPLCGMELRIPQPLSPQGFCRVLMKPYVQQIADWGCPWLMALNPTARTQCGAGRASGLPSPHSTGFSYTVPTDHKPSPALSCPGAAEIQRSEKRKLRSSAAGGTYRHRASVKKTQAVLEVLTDRLQEFQPRLGPM